MTVNDIINDIANEIIKKVGQELSELIPPDTMDTFDKLMKYDENFTDNMTIEECIEFLNNLIEVLAPKGQRLHHYPNTEQSKDLFDNTHIFSVGGSNDLWGKVYKNNSSIIVMAPQETEIDDILKPFSGIVLDSIHDLIRQQPHGNYNGTWVYTWNQIFHNIPGCRGKKLHLEMLKSIIKAVSQFGYRIKITEIKENGEFTKEAPILHYETVEEKISVNGNISISGGIQIIKYPLLLEYGKWCDKLTKHHDEFYKVPNMDDTIDNLVLKRYLVGRVLDMYIFTKNRNHKISLKKIYKKVGATKPEEQRRIRDRARKVLKHLEKVGLIRGFEEITRGKAITNFKVLLKSKKNYNILMERLKDKK